MFVLVISRSSSNLGHMGSKTRSPCQISRKLFTLQRSHFWNIHHEYCSKYLSWWFLGLVQNWVTWYQKLSHLAKSKENLVDALEVTFLKWSSWILLKMFVLMISKWCIFFYPVTFVSFFCFGQFLSNYWSYRVLFGTCEVFVLGQFLSNYCSYSQWYLVHAYILAWPLECSHPYLTLTFISQSIRHATLSYLLI